MNRQRYPRLDRSGFPERNDHGLGHHQRSHTYPNRYPPDRVYPDENPPDNYWGEFWRGERGYFRDPPSPGRFTAEPYRPLDDEWSRSSWDTSAEPWPERQPPSPWDRRRRDTAPLFEPSESWKQSHRNESPMLASRRTSTYDRLMPSEQPNGHPEHLPQFIDDFHRPTTSGYSPREYPSHNRSNSYRSEWDAHRWEPIVAHPNEAHGRERRLSHDLRNIHIDPGRDRLLDYPSVLSNRSSPPRPAFAPLGPTPRPRSPTLDVRTSPARQSSSTASKEQQKQRKKRRTRSPSTSSDASRSRLSEVLGTARKDSNSRGESAFVFGLLGGSRGQATSQDLSNPTLLATPTTHSVTRAPASTSLSSPGFTSETARDGYPIPALEKSNLATTSSNLPLNSHIHEVASNLADHGNHKPQKSQRPDASGQTGGNTDIQITTTTSIGDSRSALSITTHLNALQNLPSPSTSWPTNKSTVKAPSTSPTTSRPNLDGLKFTKKHGPEALSKTSSRSSKNDLVAPSKDTKAAPECSFSPVPMQVDPSNDADIAVVAPPLLNQSEPTTKSGDEPKAPPSSRSSLPTTGPKSADIVNAAPAVSSLAIEHVPSPKSCIKLPLIEKSTTSGPKQSSQDHPRVQGRGSGLPAMRNGNGVPHPPLEQPTEDPIVEGKVVADALRLSIIKRLQCDRQTRDERVEPVLNGNLHIAPESVCLKADPLTNEEILVREHQVQKAAVGPRSALIARFTERRIFIEEKAQRLRDEYLSLHENWLASCRRLEDTDRLSAGPEDAALAAAGRGTRRTATTLGDPVRSELEMEQIIATLGNEELTDPNHLAIRNVARIPDMLSVTHGNVEFTLDDTNNRVLDPVTFYMPRTGFEDWTQEEKEIFNERYAAHPKQFGLIADHLPHKSASQCVAYYYLHKKKFIDFRKVITKYAPNKKRRGGRGGGKGKGNALLTDIRRHDDEVASQVRSTRVRKPRFVQVDPSPISTPEPDGNGRRGKRRAAKPVSLAEPEDADEDDQKAKKSGKRARKPKVVATPDESTPAPEGDWSEKDKKAFHDTVGKHGLDYGKLLSVMPDKSAADIHQYARENYKHLQPSEPIPRLDQNTDSGVRVASQSQSGNTPGDGLTIIPAQAPAMYQHNNEQSRVFSGGPGASVPSTVYESAYDTFAPKLVPDWNNSAILTPSSVLPASGMQYRPHTLPVPMQLWTQQVAQLASVYTSQPPYGAHYVSPPTYLPPPTEMTSGRGAYPADASVWAKADMHKYGNPSR